jgi:putative ABC transport system ATP-binding protein
VLELEHVVKHYQVGTGDPVRAIDGVSLTVGAGELVVIFGPSGSGKTTLLDLISGVRKPDSGGIIVNGRNVADMSRREADNYRLRDLGIIDQADALFPGDRAIRNACLIVLR